MTDDDSNRLLAGPQDGAATAGHGTAPSICNWQMKQELQQCSQERAHYVQQQMDSNGPAPNGSQLGPSKTFPAHCTATLSEEFPRPDLKVQAAQVNGSMRPSAYAFYSGRSIEAGAGGQFCCLLLNRPSASPVRILGIQAVSMV